MSATLVAYDDNGNAIWHDEYGNPTSAPALQDIPGYLGTDSTGAPIYAGMTFSVDYTSPLPAAAAAVIQAATPVAQQRITAPPAYPGFVEVYDDPYVKRFQATGSKTWKQDYVNFITDYSTGAPRVDPRILDELAQPDIIVNGVRYSPGGVEPGSTQNAKYNLAVNSIVGPNHLYYAPTALLQRIADDSNKPSDFIQGYLDSAAPVFMIAGGFATLATGGLSNLVSNISNIAQDAGTAVTNAIPVPGASPEVFLDPYDLLPDPTITYQPFQFPQFSPLDVPTPSLPSAEGTTVPPSTPSPATPGSGFPSVPSIPGAGAAAVAALKAITGGGPDAPRTMPFTSSAPSGAYYSSGYGAQPVIGAADYADTGNQGILWAAVAAAALLAVSGGGKRGEIRRTRKRFNRSIRR